MKRTILALISLTFAISAYAQTTAVIPQFPIPGPALIEGNALNKIVNAVNNLTGNGSAVNITAGAIIGGDSSLGITGQAAAQGGAVAIVGGTSSTTGNAGGAITGVGGTPGATGVGGAVTLTGGIGGATSGTGGAASLTGGAGTGVTTTGGAASLVAGIGGTGTTTSAGGVGGAIAVTSGAGGAKTGTGAAAGGAAGALALTGGAGGATASSGSDAGGAGGTLTITGGVGGAASAGTGNGGVGGDVNLVPGAGGTSAGGTAGVGGLVKVNGGAGLTCASYVMTGTPAATDTAFFIATRAYRVISVSEVHSAAAGGASALQVVKDTSTNAPGAGTDILTNNTNTGFDLAATANTVQVGTLSATLATITLAAGDRLSIDFANTIQSTAGLVVTACLAPV